jgi:Uncharacterized ACR, COG1430
MKKPTIAISSITLLVVLATWYTGTISRADTRWSGYTSKILQVNNKQYTLWVADDYIKHYQGLSDITDLSQLQGKQGMVFEFGSSSIQSFVNRRTYLNLTVIWMNEDTVVGEDRLPKLAETDNKEVVVTSLTPVTRGVELVGN